MKSLYKVTTRSTTTKLQLNVMHVVAKSIYLAIQKASEKMLPKEQEEIVAIELIANIDIDDTEE